MGEGVSPSLSRDGFPVANHLVVSDSSSYEHVISHRNGLSVSVLVSFYGGSNSDASHRISFYLASSVSSTRKPVSNRDVAYSDDRASKVILDDNSTIYAVVIAGYGVAGTSDVSSTVHGGFSSDRQGLLQHSLVPLRSDHKERPKASVPLRSGCHDAPSPGVGHDLPISGQQVPGFIGSGEPAKARCGGMPRSWPFLRKSDLGPNLVKGVVKGDRGGTDVGSRSSGSRDLKIGGFSNVTIFVAAVDTDYGEAAAIVVGGCTVSGIGSKLRERLDGFGSSGMTRRRRARKTSQFNACVVQRTVGEGRPVYSILGSGFVEIDLLFLLVDLVSAGGSWVLNPGSLSIPAPTLMTGGSLDLLLSSDPSGIFVISNSWIPGVVIHTVPSPSPTTGSEELISSDSGRADSFEVFNESQVLISHDRDRAPVTVTSMLNGNQTTPTMSSDFGCCWGLIPSEVLGRSTWVKTR